MRTLQVKIQALAFSPDEQRLASLGGQDDNSLVLWDVESGEAICGSPTHADFVLCCRFFSNQSDKLITAGNYNLQVGALAWHAGMMLACAGLSAT